MSQIRKRPLVIRDLIELATYIAESNLDASDRFLASAEETFKQLDQMPQMGRLCQFSHPSLDGIRQRAVKGFRRYIIFYRATDLGIEIIRVIHGARDIEAILELDLGEEQSEN